MCLVKLRKAKVHMRNVSVHDEELALIGLKRILYSMDPYRSLMDGNIACNVWRSYTEVSRDDLDRATVFAPVLGQLR